MDNTGKNKKRVWQTHTWKKGQPSPNPAGRPKRTPEEIEVDALCRTKTLGALSTIEQLMHESTNESVRLKAAQYILDRGHGKPKERVEARVNLAGEFFASLSGRLVGSS
jgi:hypothetical protein